MRYSRSDTGAFEIASQQGGNPSKDTVVAHTVGTHESRTGSAANSFVQSTRSPYSVGEVVSIIIKCSGDRASVSKVASATSAEARTFVPASISVVTLGNPSNFSSRLDCGVALVRGQGTLATSVESCANSILGQAFSQH